LTANVSDPCGTTFGYQWYSDNACATAISNATSSTYTASAQSSPKKIVYSYKTKDVNGTWSNCATATAQWNQTVTVTFKTNGATSV